MSGESKYEYQRPQRKYQFNQENINWYLIVAMIIYRTITCAFLLVRSAQAQQYWNYVQAAHKFAYGNGGLNWEMSLDIPLRSYFFLTFASAPYAILKIFNIEDIILIRYAPKLFAITISVMFDYFLLKLNSIYNPGTQKLLLLLYLMQFCAFNTFSCVHSNNQEALLCLIAFYLWKIKQTNKYYDFVSRFLVVIGFMCRISIIMVWGIIWPYELLTMKGTIMDKIKFILKNILTIVAMIMGSIIFMYFYTGKWICTEYEFMKLNFGINISFFYGIMPYLNYLKYFLWGELYPLHFSLLVYGIFIIFKHHFNRFTKEKQFTLIYLIFPFLVINSSLHKQFRFLLILFPPIFIIITKGYTSIPKKFKILKYFGILIVIIHNMIRTRDVSAHYNNDNKIIPLLFLSKRQSVKSIMFLIDAYQIPIYSVIHKNIDTAYLISDPQYYKQDYALYAHENSNELFNILYKHFQEPPTHILTVKYQFEHKKCWDKKNYELLATFGRFLIYERKI